MHELADKIVAAAKSYEGVRFRHQGRNRAGMDCAGLVMQAGKDAGVIAEGFNHHAYSRRPDVESFTQAMVAAGCFRLPFGQHEHGDILRFAFEGFPVHIGIYEVAEKGEEFVIHAFAPYRKVVRERLTPAIKDKISTVWRFAE